MKVLITGDSHTGTLRLGQKELINKREWPTKIDLAVKPLGGGGIIPTPFFIDKGAFAEICNPEYRKQFERFPPKELENNNVIYGFMSPLHSGRVRRKQDWSKFVPSQFTIHETPVSNALLDRTILDDCQYLLNFIDVILRKQNKVFAVEAPKPFRHDGSLKAIRAEVFLYIDSYYRNFIKQQLNLRNVHVIEVPRECYDDSGFMLDRYKVIRKKPDAHHANQEFGVLMMKQILDFLLQE